MEFFRRILKLFTHKSTEEEAAPQSTPPPFVRPSAADLSDEDYRTRALCELATALAPRPAYRYLGSEKVRLPLYMPNQVIDNSEEYTYTYRGVVRNGNKLEYTEFDHSDSQNIVNLFPEGSANVAAAFYCIAEKESGNRAVNIVNVLPKSISNPDGGRMLLLRTASDDPSLQGEALQICTCHYSGISKEAAIEQKSKFTKDRLQAYACTFEGKPLSRRQRIAVNRFSLAEAAETYGSVLDSGSFIDEDYQNLQNAFFRLLDKYTANLCPEQEQRLLTIYSAKFAAFHYRKGAYDRANYFANLALWIADSLPWLTPEQMGNLKQAAEPGLAKQIWSRFKPTRFGSALFTLYSATPADIKDMLVVPCSTQEPHLRIAPEAAWNFDFIAAAKTYGEFTAFIALGQSAIVTFHAKADEAEVNTTFQHIWSIEDYSPDASVSLRYPIDPYFTREQFLEHRDRVSEDIVEGKTTKDDEWMWLSRNEAAQIDCHRAAIANNMEWHGELLYRLYRVVAAINKAKADGLQTNEYDDMLETTTILKIVDSMLQANRNISALGWISGQDNSEFFSLLLLAYTAMHDPRLDNIANTLLSDQEKLMLDSNFIAGKIEASPEELDRFKQQVDAFRPHRHDPLFCQPVMGAANSTLLQCGQKAKYYALCYAQEIEKAKIYLQSIRIHADDRLMKFIEDSTAYLHQA